jgi:hypothetical protein
VCMVSAETYKSEASAAPTTRKVYRRKDHPEDQSLHFRPFIPPCYRTAPAMTGVCDIN